MPEAATISIDLNKQIGIYDAEIRKNSDRADELVAAMTSEERDFTDQEQKEYDECRGKIVSATKRKKLVLERIEDRTKLGDISGPKSRPVGIDPEGDLETRKSKDERLEGEYRSAFNNYLRRGYDRVSRSEKEILDTRMENLDASNDPELRALSAITNTAGGYTVPTELQNKIFIAMKQFAGILNTRATVLPTSGGGPLPWPTGDDTNNEGELLVENTDAAEQDVVFGLATLNAYMFSSKIIRLPIQLLMDSVLDVETYIANRLAERIGRSLNRHLTVGTGTSQPQGIVTGSTLGVTAAGAAAITYDETIELEHSVDPAYRMNAEYAFNDTTCKLFRKLKDSDGRPIWLPAATGGMAAGAPGLLNGHPYTILPHMANPGATNKSIIFGDFSNFIVRQVKAFTLIQIRERYVEKLQVGYLGYSRFDSRLINAGANPVKHLVHP